MGEATDRTEASLAAIRESLNLVHAQMGSMDSMGLLDTAYLQVAAQLDLHSRAVSDHTRVMDAMERWQEMLAQHMAATAEAVARLCGSKAPSIMEDHPGATPVAGTGSLRQVPVSVCHGAPLGGGFFPGLSSSARPPDPGRGMERPLIDPNFPTPGASGEQHQGGAGMGSDTGRGGEHMGCSWIHCWH